MGTDAQETGVDEMTEKLTGANNVQVAGTHYKQKPMQPWDYIAANNIGFFEGNVIKYVTRWKDKGGLEDLYKAKHYLEKLIEINL